MAKPGLKLETGILRRNHIHQEKVSYVSCVPYEKIGMLTVHLRLPSGVVTF